MGNQLELLIGIAILPEVVQAVLLFFIPDTPKFLFVVCRLCCLCSCAVLLFDSNFGRQRKTRRRPRPQFPSTKASQQMSPTLFVRYWSQYTGVLSTGDGRKESRSERKQHRRETGPWAGGPFCERLTYAREL